VASLNCIDLFSGCGGMSLGFENAGFKVLLGIDFDKKALETFEKNHKNSKIIYNDITKISYKTDIKKILKNEKIDVIIGGPPCQGMSLSGPRKFNDPRNKLYLSYIRLVKEIEPKAFVIENVPGLLGLFKGAIKDNILKEFSKIGYSMKYNVLCASNYGVPQKRKRVFFIGIKGTENDFEFPLADKMEISCEMALSDLPQLKDSIGEQIQHYTKAPQNRYQKNMRVNSNTIKNHIAANHSEKVKNIISFVPDGGNYKNLPEEYMGSRNFNVAWTRFSRNKPAPTIDTGHRHHFHYEYNRVPTVRECARLQSFPDNFIFYGSKTEQFRQVGNAVPPLMAQKIAESLLYCLTKE